MRAALAALPGVRHVDVDFEKKQAMVTIEKAAYDEQQLVKSLKDAGFGGSVRKSKAIIKTPEVEADERAGGIPAEHVSAEVHGTTYSLAPFAEHLQVSAHLDHETLGPHDFFRIAVVFDIEKGWHIYGNPLGPGIGKETVISAEGPEGFEFEAARYSAAHRNEQDFGDVGKTWVWEHTGKTVHFLSGKVSGGTQPGAYELTVKASAQVCTEGACFPGTATIRLPVTVVAADEESQPANQEFFDGFDGAKSP